MESSQQLVEIEAIKRLKARYQRAVDTKDWELVRSVLAPDARSVYSDGKYAFEGREAIVKFLSDGLGSPEIQSMHHAHTPEIEITGDGVDGDGDGDGDGVTDEASIADVTATTIYSAGQPRPVTELELHALRQDLVAEDAVAGALLADELGLPDLSQAEIDSINAGEAAFAAANCGSCHMPELLADGSVFSEPSSNPNYRDNGTFPAGQDADIDTVAFDLTTDMLDNHIELGGFFRNVANFETNGAGQMVVRLYGDLKRHDMGPGLAESIDEVGTGHATFITKELWGVGSTPPYLHDGRATTVTEAILEHGGEAEVSRQLYEALSAQEQADLARFLRNLVIFKVAEE